MNGIIIGPRNDGKVTLLGSLSRSMVIQKQEGQEFIGTNEPWGLNPPIMKWLETGSPSLRDIQITRGLLYSFTIQAPSENLLGNPYNFGK